MHYYRWIISLKPVTLLIGLHSDCIKPQRVSTDPLMVSISTLHLATHSPLASVNVTFKLIPYSS